MSKPGLRPEPRFIGFPKKSPLLLSNKSKMSKLVVPSNGPKSIRQGNRVIQKKRAIFPKPN